jgi:hypothetical protein
MSTKNDKNVLLTDTETTSSEVTLSLPTDADWGVDTVNLSFPVCLSACDESSSIWTKSSSLIDLETGQEYSGWTGCHSTSHGDVRVSLNVTKQRCYLQFNAARLLHGKSKELLPPAALKPLVGNLLEDLQYAVMPDFDIDEHVGVLSRRATWASEVKLTRIDLARNFEIRQSINEVKKALELAKPRYGKTKISYEKSDGGWTLVNGTSSTGQDRIYDKSHELKTVEMEEQMSQNLHIFRFEAQLQKDRLKRSGITTLEAVTEEKCWLAIIERWDACQWAITVNEPGTLGKALAALEPKRQKDVAGYLYMASIGTDVLLTRAYRTEMRKVCRQLGLSVGMPLYEQGIGLLKLDLMSGELVPPTL